MIVKICGIKTLSDALAAIDVGADMLGYNFYPKSKRYISIKECVEIQNDLVGRGMDVISVGVFVNASYKTIINTMDICALNLVQLHGDESPELLEELGEWAFKAIRPQSAEEALNALNKYPQRADAPALLVDAYHPSEYGGSGTVGDWSLAKELAAQKPILLAGGLTPENVGEAVRQVRPWGVDVASGVEASPGVKDVSKISAFISAAKNVNLKGNPNG
ncbi:MAG: phosphoribosylanthranilate isomerase [Chloroflexi bacterium]|nr:phosphoribosylanthranilate isomerase [Chloroflexota bacterium]